MSILLKALKQAATDRNAGRHAPPPSVPGKKPSDAALARRDVDAGGTGATHDVPAYGALWITLALAVISAGGFGYWMRGMAPIRPQAPLAGSFTAAMPPAGLMAAPASTPSTLKMHEAGPLQLRLDRHLDTPPVRAR
ncbi:MAG: hypothetical protein ABI790_09660 [Betaproteobacteria bacterium]